MELIPDYIIETAMDAYVENFPGTRCMRINMEAALEAVAAEIWDQGYMRGRHPWVTLTQEDDPIPPADSPPRAGRNASPYRASEGK